MKHGEFEPLLARAHAHASSFLDDLPDRFVGARAGREEMIAALDGPLPAHGEAPDAVLDLMAGQAERGASGCAAPRYFGFVIGGSLPVALAADWLVSTWDQNAGIHVISPLAAALEEIAAHWLLDLLDLPRESGVGFVTGCQMAHFTCLAAARHGVLRRAGWDVEADGLHGAPRIHVVASAEAHVTVDVALRYLGLGTRALDPVDHTAARAPGHQGKHEPRSLRRAAVDARAHAQRAVPAMHHGRMVFLVFEFGPPDQRRVAEDP